MIHSAKYMDGHWWIILVFPDGDELRLFTVSNQITAVATVSKMNGGPRND